MATYKVVDADSLDASLESVADAIRAKTGSTDTMTLADMPTEIGNISTGTTLDHTVTIKNDQGVVQAVYTVKDGVGNIAEPSGIVANKWRCDGERVTFPISPTSDMIITADNVIINSDEILEKQGLSSEYVYIFIGYNNGTTNSIYITTNKASTTSANRYRTGSAYYYSGYVSNSTLDTYEKLVDYLKNNKITWTQGYDSVINLYNNNLTNFPTLQSGWLNLNAITQ